MGCFGRKKTKVKPFKEPNNGSVCHRIGVRILGLFHLNCPCKKCKANRIIVVEKVFDGRSSEASSTTSLHPFAPDSDDPQSRASYERQGRIDHASYVFRQNLFYEPTIRRPNKNCLDGEDEYELISADFPTVVAEPRLDMVDEDEVLEIRQPTYKKSVSYWLPMSSE